MQKKLIAVAVAGLMSGAAFAQTNVVISGSLDFAYTQYTNDQDAGAVLASSNGHGDTTHKTNRIAFKGTEALGGGLSAFFELEERFDLDTGNTNGNGRFARSSWVGLQGGFGKVWLGRTPTAADLVFGGAKIGNDDTIADWGSRRGAADDRQANGIAYQSPKLGPLTLNVHTAVKESNTMPAPFGVSAALTFGPAFVEAAYQKDGANQQGGTAQSASNQYRSKILNAGVKLGSAANLYAYVGQSKGYEVYLTGGAPTGVAPSVSQLRYAIAGDLRLNPKNIIRVNLGKAVTTSTTASQSTDGARDTKYYQLGFLYQHELSKRTKLNFATTYERAGNHAKNIEANPAFTSPYQSRDDGKANRNNRAGIQIGIRHAF